MSRSSHLDSARNMEELYPDAKVGCPGSGTRSEVFKRFSAFLHWLEIHPFDHRGSTSFGCRTVCRRNSP